MMTLRFYGWPLAGNGTPGSRKNWRDHVLAMLGRVVPLRSREPAVYVAACCGDLIQWEIMDQMAVAEGELPMPAELHIAKMARDAIQLEDARDLALADVLPDFAYHVELLNRLMEQDGRDLAEVDRHPIVLLYARRVAELAGVQLSRNEEVSTAADQARAWCERAARTWGWKQLPSASAGER